MTRAPPGQSTTTERVRRAGRQPGGVGMRRRRGAWEQCGAWVPEVEVGEARARTSAAAGAPRAESAAAPSSRATSWRSAASTGAAWRRGVSGAWWRGESGVGCWSASAGKRRKQGTAAPHRPPARRWAHTCGSSASAMPSNVLRGSGHKFAMTWLAIERRKGGDIEFNARRRRRRAGRCGP